MPSVGVKLKAVVEDVIQGGIDPMDAMVYCWSPCGGDTRLEERREQRHAPRLVVVGPEPGPLAMVIIDVPPTLGQRLMDAAILPRRHM